MTSSKLSSLLLSFSKQDIIRFEKFILSPFFNEDQNQVKLFALLKQTEGYRKDKKEVWEILFPGVPYKDIVLRRLISDTIKSAEQFLFQKSIESKSNFETPFILSELSTLSLEKHFHSYKKLQRKNIEKQGKRNVSYYELEYKINQELHRRKDKISPEQNDLQDLRTADDYLDAFYYAEKLGHYNALLIYSKVRKIELNLSVPEEFLSTVKNSIHFQEPLINIHFHINKLLRGDNPEHQFELLLELYQKYEHFFEYKEMQNFYLYLQNFCAIQINKGEAVYLKRLFEIYKILIERKLLGQSGMKTGVYKNIITVGLIVEEFDWTENFIQTYTAQLPKDDQVNSLNYNLAKVYFHKKEYEEVIDQLREVEYKNHIYALGGKLLLMRTYFELKESRALDSLIDSFRIYLRRNKLISKNVKQQYMNSLRFTKKLANLAPYDEKGRARVKEQILKCKALAAKQWLLEKIAEK